MSYKKTCKIINILICFTNIINYILNLNDNNIHPSFLSRFSLIEINVTNATHLKYNRFLPYPYINLN